MNRLLGGLLAAVLSFGSLPQPPAAASVVEEALGGRAVPELGASRNPEPAHRAHGGQALAGKVVVLDAGHQLGNHNFPEEINRLVPAGGFSKPCNTTGTSTNGGYAEATFAWNVTMKLKAKLEKSGATVVLTRTSNREDRWGPCVDVRGRAGNTLRWVGAPT